MSDTTVAILAGGEGSRLDGQDKGLVELAGRPLIEWVLAALEREGHSGVLILANRNLPQYRHYAECIQDATPGFAGPLAGIATALSNCSTPWLATAPVDCPMPPCGWLSRLRQAANSAHESSAVVALGDRRQPLFALYNTALAESAAQQLRRDGGVARWQDRVGSVQVDLSDLPGDWSNLNTAGEFRLAEERLRAVR